MYIDVKETIKKYILVRKKEACDDEWSLEPILSSKKPWCKSGCYKWKPVSAIRLWGIHLFFIDDSEAEFPLH